ncbi:MAG: transcriptional regulator [Nitrososphaerota archaeon]
MSDKSVGAVLLIGSIIGILIYAWLMFFAPNFDITLWAIRITLFAGVGAILTILGWIGYTLVSTPPPEPITELEQQKIETTEEKK